MKKQLLLLVGLLGALQVGAQTFPVQNLVVNGTFTATGKVGLPNLAPQVANTLIANVTAASATPTAVGIPSCSSSSSALQWISGVGFACGSFIGLTGATFIGPVNLSYVNPVLAINDQSGTNKATLAFQNIGTQEWGVANTSSTNTFTVDRYNAGTYVDSPIAISNSTGGVVLPDGITTPSANITNLTVGSSFTATGLVTGSDLAAINANSLLGNSTAGATNPGAVSVPSCSAGGTALQWISGTGFSCASGYVNSGVAFQQTATGQFFGNLGARINDINDRLFIGALTPYNGNQSTVPPDWTGSSFLNGGVPAFGYLEQNGTLDVSAIKGQLPIVAAVRTSDGAGGGTESSIGVSSVVLNDNSTGGGAFSWGFYGTTVRTAASTGQNTFGMELDVENLGAAAPIYPNSIFTHGETVDMWLAAGGELANQSGAGYTFNNTSAAIAILSNNGAGYANVQYDKGIVFGATALNGNGTAIAFYTGQYMQWFNATNQVVSQISSTETTVATGQQLQFSPVGTAIDDMSGNIQFLVSNGVTNAADFVQVVPQGSGGGSFLVAGSNVDSNVNLNLTGKGTGGALTKGSTGGSNAPAGYVGEFPTPSNLTGVGLSTTVAANVSSMVLTAGNWDVQCTTQYTPASTTTAVVFISGVSTTSGALGVPGTYAEQVASMPAGLGSSPTIVSPTVRYNFTGSTTVYCIADSNFSVSTMTAGGYLRATRVP
jgi:hypothetical protein